MHKACCIPVCDGLKFGLVHKFPSDAAKYKEWLDILEISCGVPDKIKVCTQEQVKKRFFICSSHFGVSSYKNAESRSLNITANPHLNLTNLTDYKLSKAYQLENSSKTTQQNPQDTKNIQLTPVEVPKMIKILNTEAASTKSYTPKTGLVRMDLSTIRLTSPTVINARAPKRSNLLTLSSSPKHIKLETGEAHENFIDIQPPSPADLTTKTIKETVKSPQIVNTSISLSETPKNKLLALFEVTPDQYNELTERLSASERSSKVESILTSFLDSKKFETETLNENEIEILIEDDKSLKLDLFWLRDHCRCASCYDHSTFQRKISILDIPEDIRAKNHSLKDATLEVIWSDGHESSYSLEFLIKNQYDTESEIQQRILWTKVEMESPLKSSCRCVMRDYMSDTDVSKSVLENLHRYGVAFIDGVQPTQQNTEFVIRQLFPIHRTLFGDMWTFSDEKRDHSDTAYTNYYLGAHNDNTYFNDASGLQILHCILQQCTGGENFLIDGFQVAKKLKEEQPEVFKRLTTTLVTSEYIEEGHHHKYVAPIIRLDPTGNEIEQIRFNLYDRAPLNTIAMNKMRQFYSDLKILAKELENPENRVTFKLEPGTVMIFDNWRVLHGRNAYTGKRTMTGCYVQRSEFLSALRKNNFIE